jgi:hypothetical protein
LQDKIQREGTVSGKEFETAARQGRKRALIELPVISTSATVVPPASGGR